MLTCISREKVWLRACESIYSVKLIDDIETNENYYLIFELCDTNLELILENKHRGLTIIEIQEIFDSLNQGFKEMWEKWVIIRDLKLVNFLIKFNNEKKEFITKLSDYGFSKIILNNKECFFCSRIRYTRKWSPWIVIWRKKLWY